MRMSKPSVLAIRDSRGFGTLEGARALMLCFSLRLPDLTRLKRKLICAESQAFSICVDLLEYWRGCTRLSIALAEAWNGLRQMQC